MNIIVRMPNWIGDLVMATAALIDLRKAFPGAKITAMCRAPLGDLLLEDPSIDEIFSFSKPSNSFSRREEKRDIIEKIRAGKFDLGILFTNSISSAWWFFRGNVKRRIGYGRSLLLSDSLSFPKEKIHQVDLYKNLLSCLKIPRSTTSPLLHVTPLEMESARRLFPNSKKIIGINPGSAYGEAKCWLPDRFRALAEALVNEGFSCVFFGDRALPNLPKGTIDLGGKTTLRELMCLIQLCDVFVTNDSGPMHIAASFNVPLVSIFGSTDERVTGPFGQPESVMTKSVSCSPCLKRVCPIDFRCMTRIAVGEVLAMVHKQLRV